MVYNPLNDLNPFFHHVTYRWVCSIHIALSVMKPIIRRYKVMMYTDDPKVYAYWFMGITFPVLKRYILRKRKEGYSRFCICLHDRL